MRGFLLDTNVISELRKGARANAGLREWFDSVESNQLFVIVLVIGEVRRGIEQIRRRDPRSAQHLEAWLMHLREEFADRILGVSEEIAELWGELGLDAPLPPIDGLIAATALYHGLTLVTRNEKDVSRAPVAIINPFS